VNHKSSPHSICFFYRWLPEELKSKLRFSGYPIPTILRVHPFLYASIEKLARLATPLDDLEAAAAAAASAGAGEAAAPAAKTSVHLHIIPFVGSESGVEDAMALIGKLKAYDLSVFDRFFWTDGGTEAALSAQTLVFGRSRESHYATDTLSLELDSQRSRTWTKLSKVLANSPSDRNTLSVSDPCSLNRAQARVSLGKITISIAHLLQHQDPQVGAACLSFITAHLTSPSDSPVFSVGLFSEEVLLNNNARSITQGSGVGNSFETYTSQSLLGKGQVVQVADTGVDVGSCYFFDASGRVPPSDMNSGGAPNVDSSKRKVISYVYAGSQGDSTDGPGGHGTHVAGTIAGNMGGDILTTGQYDGVASGAQLAVLDLAAGSSEALAIPSSADLLFGSGYSAGARIHSNSWGSFFSAGDTGYYSSSDIDGYLYNHPDSTAFFAAGNGGAVSYAISQQAQSKNTVSVGSSETTRNSLSIANVAYYSSFGPAYDGRIKPDVVSPGDELKSANSVGDGSQSCGTINKTGTSQATPGCAGTAALVRQYFADSSFFQAFCESGSASSGSGAGCNAFDPSGVLVKAAILHSGSPLSLYDFGDSTHDQTLGAPPDAIQGYGRVTLTNVFPLPQIGGEYKFHLFVEDQLFLGSDASSSYTIEVTDSSFPLKITLCWYDPPNQDGVTTNALLHDLDLELTGPSGERLVGNGGNSGHAAFDVLNNTELVWVASPGLGTWTATVTARALVAADSQAFSLVATMRGSVDGNGGSGGGGGGGGGGSGGGGNDGNSGSVPGPAPTDDYQVPGQAMRIKPSSALTARHTAIPDASCLCPPSPYTSSLLQPSPAPTPLAPSAAPSPRKRPRSASPSKTKKSQSPSKQKKSKSPHRQVDMNKDAPTDAEALSVNWVEVVHSDDGDPRKTSKGQGHHLRRAVRT